MRSAAALTTWWLLFLIFISTRINTPSTPSSPSPSRHLLQLTPAQALNTSTPPPPSPLNTTSNTNQNCRDVRTHFNFPDTCSFIRAHPQCSSGGFIDYTSLFFCTFASLPWLGYVFLGFWLAALFYMLGNTAADYFCCSLQKLSSLLNLPPTVAGVTLLPLGNGAPDVFASIAAFLGAGAGEVGLNSVLGGGVFVTTVVAGLVYVITSGASVELDRSCFIRDVCFYIFTLVSLTLILYVGKVSFWGAVAFISIYVLYAVSVAASEVIKKQAAKLRWRPIQALIEGESEDSWYSPLMDPESLLPDSHPVEITLPQWRWASNVAIYAHQQSVEEEEAPRSLWGNEDDEEMEYIQPRAWKRFVKHACRIIDGPLTLPRQLTIPVVEDTRWSRPVAVASALLAPILLAVLFGSGTPRIYHFLGFGAAAGAVFGVVAFLTTVSEHPPRKFLFPWVAGGFLMSIVWFYIIASELVGALVSLGIVLEIDSSILGLTVLAWGNSMGDLMSNIAMAINGGDGVQVAVSGCYAGPMFNTLAGLGVSLLLASLKTFPSSFVIPVDTSLFYTIGFLVLGLVWTLFLLPARRMQPSRLLGVGLLVLYALFLGVRISQMWGNASGSV